MPILPNSNFSTSRLGFGTSGIMGSAFSNRGRLRLLSYAFELGITHFDTAPLYGMGEAEPLIGKFVSDKRDKLSVATKFGLSPRSLSWCKKIFLPTARYVNRKSIRLKKIVTTGKATSGRSSVSSPDSKKENFPAKYSVKDIEYGLHQSLQKLNTDYIDVYLLHECRLENLSDDVFTQLDGFIKAGKVLSYGLATNKSEVGKILKEYPQFKGCIQIGSNIIDNNLGAIDVPNNLLTISHSAVAGILPKVQEYLNSNRQTLNRWSEELDCDLVETNALSKLLLLDSLLANQQGIVLFSSSKKENIQSNVELQNQCDITCESTSKLKNLIQTELLDL